MKTIVLAAALTGLLATATPALAGGAMKWEGLPRAAFFEVYNFFCAPASFELASITPQPRGTAAEIHDGLFLGTYAGDCRAFYFKEIVRRIDRPTQQGLIVVER